MRTADFNGFLNPSIIKLMVKVIVQGPVARSMASVNQRLIP